MSPLRPLARLGRRVRAFVHGDGGTSTIEFVLVFPIVMTLFFSAFESGLLALRFVMMERGLDMTVRELRLGQIPSPTHDKLKQEVCRLAAIIPDCMNVLMLELAPVNTTTWTGLPSQTTCIDRSEDINNQQPPNFNPGSGDNLMMVRACALFDPMFPTTGLGLAMNKDATGAYHLVASSAFVNEPG